MPTLRPMVPSRWLYLLSITLILLQHYASPVLGEANEDNRRKRKRIAVIGGGVGGAFAARYLADYDTTATVSCTIESITVFDPSPLLQTNGACPSEGQGKKPSADKELGGPDWQGPRVSAIRLSDGTVAELGASIIYSGNKLVTDMVESDPSLIVDTATDARGLGIYNGDGGWSLSLNPQMSSWGQLLALVWRYNFDLIRMRSRVFAALDTFMRFYDMLKDNHTFFSSPKEMWKAVGLYELTTISYDDYLTSVGISQDDALLKKIVPFQGSMRRELLTAANLCNYNQDNHQINGLAGLVSFLPSQGHVYKVKGGNAQVLASAFRQAKEEHDRFCASTGNGSSSVGHVQKIVSSVVATDSHLKLYTAEKELLGEFDVVILAAPLQHCRISFEVETLDGGATLPMPFLNGELTCAANVEEQKDASCQTLPPSATRPYTQTVTTIVSNATLSHEYFKVNKATEIPGAVMVTERGKELEKFSSIGTTNKITGVYKVFSSEPLANDKLTEMFGPDHELEHVKVWGGPHGGAYPDFDGGGTTPEKARMLPFLLYNGPENGTVTDTNNNGPGLYYVNTIESSASAMEISAIGAKAVSKLVARRLELL